jgi:hypothetical protein
MEPHGPTCDANCSWKQSPESLRSLGYEIPELRPDAGVPEKMKWQRAVATQKHQAWLDGKTRLCTKTTSATQFNG